MTNRSAVQAVRSRILAPVTDSLEHPQLPPAMADARSLVAALLAEGVREVVLCPGSRSAPLAEALADAADAGRLRLRAVLDERSAGFIALGAARAHALNGHSRCAAVVTTSGTAVSNLHPAVSEADAAGIPLLVVSADRPHELVGTGASQTTEQTGLFAPALRLGVDLRVAMGRPGGGAWTWARLSMSSSQGYKLISDFNYDREPVLDPPYTAQDVTQELEAFPREPNAIPDWMRIGG